MRDDTTSIQVISFTALLFFILFVYKYYVDNYERPLISVHHNNYEKPVDHSNDKVRCPPQDLVLKEKQSKVLKHVNDLDIVNDKVNLYEGQEINTYGFENELGNNTKISKEFTSELEEMYVHDQLPQYKSYNSCGIKPHKSDLPIVNVPLYVLKDNQPLRLSEKPML